MRALGMRALGMRMRALGMRALGMRMRARASDLREDGGVIGDRRERVVESEDGHGRRARDCHAPAMGVRWWAVRSTMQGRQAGTMQGRQAGRLFPGPYCWWEWWEWWARGVRGGCDALVAQKGA
jgi:hypothetical protein